MDVKALVDRIQSERKSRRNVTLSVNSDTYDRMTEIAKELEIPTSRLIDELMKDFIQGYEAEGGQGKGKGRGKR